MTSRRASEARAVRSLRWCAWRHQVRLGRLIGTAAVLGIVLTGNWVNADTERLARSQPPSDAPVTRLDRSPRGGLDVYVEINGRERELVDGNSIRGGVAVGQPVRVVVDPDDASHVVAVDGRQGWEYTVVGSWAFFLFGAAGVWVIGFLGRQPRGLVRALRRPDLMSGVVLDCRPHGDHGHQVDLEVEEHRMTWTGDAGPAGLAPGAVVRVAGRIRPGGWAALLTDHGERLWPEDSPLEATA